LSSSDFDSCVVASEAKLDGRDVGAEISELPVLLPHEFVQPAVVLGVFADDSVGARQELLVDGLDERVEADVLAAHVQPDVRFARRRNAQPLVKPHRHRLVYPRRILGQIVEDERLETEEFLVGRIPVEVDFEARLVGIARTAAARADADVADRLAVPDEVRGIVGVGLEVFLEFRPIRAVHFEVEALQRRGAEQIVRGLRGHVGRCKNEQTPEGGL
jgi:hypothetical protein